MFNSCISIDWALIPMDIPDICAIELQDFEFPWSKKDLTRCIKLCPTIVAKFEDQIIGFMVYEPRKKTIWLLRLVVTEEFRRLGVGSQMLQVLIDKMPERKWHFVKVDVRETNLSAQLFLRAMEFRWVSTLGQFYSEEGEDAYVMEYGYRPSSENEVPAFKGKNRFGWLLK